jgi:hypothetical protein
MGQKFIRKPVFALETHALAGYADYRRLKKLEGLTK